MPSMESSKYNSSQSELYATARLAVSNYNVYQSNFTAFSPSYNKQYAINLLAEIIAAEKLPSENARSGMSEDNRIVLSQAVSDCRDKWKALKRYIVKGFSAERSPAMLKVAGQSFYFDAGNLNWNSVVSLVNHGSDFIKEHQTELVANENMPPSFGDDFDAVKTLYLDLQTKFFGTVSNTTQATQTKIKANNIMYEKLKHLLQDGQQIFSKDDGIKQQFVFSSLKSIVSGVNQAGIRGFVTDAVTGVSINAAALATANNVYTSVTDIDGRIDMKNMAAGDYKLTVSAINYLSQTLDITVKIGTVSTQNILLEKEVV
jgi:hypothetical protein